ncbi:MAP kinase-activating death domain protein-like isoform X2 [Rhopilema esculentum]|uniref:MAP kinase-activating death domain protein-like isoform X2 n=1 Tax=Rhopilema esculentum TaxID=499914 RepID=UPI0031D065CF
MSRLIDYLIVVGNRQPVLESTQAPELLRCFPEQPHKDFPLPVDVVFFCQPEGCVSASKRLSLKDTNSFVFTLTEKDSGIVRYGICCNFFRPCIGLKSLDRERDSVFDDSYDSKPSGESLRHLESSEIIEDGSSYKSVSCRSLTSLCIISERPFLSTFRECLFVLRKIVETRNLETVTLGKIAENWDVVTEGNHMMKYIPKPNSRNWSMFLNPESFAGYEQINEIREIELWIDRLLTVPPPIAGVNRIEVELLPRHIQPPLTFALPEKSRFSMLDFPLHLPLELLGVDTCLKVLTCILLENKVLLQSDDYNALSISVMALTSMLYPLEYMFPMIPLLPTCMKNAEQLLLAPTPYVIGVPSSFLHYKTQYFQIPTDVLIVDLDTSKMGVPLSMDEIPQLPEPEGSILREQLKQCLDCLSLYPHSMHDLGVFADNESIGSHRTSTSGSKLSEIIYGNDIDSVDVAIRASLVKFFTSPNVIGEFAQHCRILRLYSRPVVAFQKDTFVYSRPTSSELLPALADTQAAEYYAEWLVNPTNTVYRKVQSGILDPRVVGDKPRWYSHYLAPVYYQVHNPHSSLGHDLLDDSDDSGPLFDDEDDLSDSDISLGDEEYMHLQKERTLSVDLDLTTKAREQISELYDSSYSSFNTLENGDHNREIIDSQRSSLPALNTQSSVFRSRAHRQECCSPGSDEGKVLPSTVQSILDPARSSVDDADEKSSPSDAGERVFKKKPLTPSSSIGQKAKDVLSRQSSSASERLNALIGQIKPRLSQKSSIESEVSVQSFVSSGSSECNSMPTPPMQQKAFSYPYPLSEIEEGNSLRLSIPDRLVDRSSFGGQKTIKDTRFHNAENQQVINDVVTNVLKGDGVGWFSQKKLRKLLVHESLRQYLFKQLYEPKEQDEEDEAVSDIHVSRNTYRGIVELLRFLIEGYEHSAKQKGIGGLASLFSMLEVMHTHYCGKRIQDGGVNPSKKKDTKIKENGQKLRMTLSLDAKSDSSIVYTRASPIQSVTERVSSIFAASRGDYNDNSITKMNGGQNGSVERGSSSDSAPSLDSVSHNRDSFDGVFEGQNVASHDSRQRRSSSQSGSFDDERAGQGTVKKLPSLSHTTLSSKTQLNSSMSVGDLSATDVQESVDERNLVCKSNLCAGYRFRDGRLYEAKKERVSKGITGTGRRFIFEGLLNPRSSIWDDMDFWEHCFYDSVAAEREMVGMDIGPVELLERYKSLGSAERRCLEEEEDKLLSTVLHNMIAFMVTMQVDKTKMKRKIRRLLGKSHIGLVHTQCINVLLDNIDNLHGNDIDLRPLRSRTMKKHVFVVHLGEDQSGPVFFIEVCDDCMLIKSTNGGIVERWWYENVLNMSCSPRAKILCLWIKSGELTRLEKISTKKCKSLYTSIKESMEKTSRKFKGLERGMELGGEFDVVDLNSNKEGLLRVSLDGISIIFVDGKCAIDIRNLKNCSRKESILYIQEYVPHTHQVIEHELYSHKAGEICYSVLCLFSYLAAASNGVSSEPRGSEGGNSL